MLLSIVIYSNLILSDDMIKESISNAENRFRKTDIEFNAYLKTISERLMVILPSITVIKFCGDWINDFEDRGLGFDLWNRVDLSNDLCLAMRLLSLPFNQLTDHSIKHIVSTVYYDYSEVHQRFSDNLFRQRLRLKSILATTPLIKFCGRWMERFDFSIYTKLDVSDRTCITLFKLTVKPKLMTFDLGQFALQFIDIEVEYTVVPDMLYRLMGFLKDKVFMDELKQQFPSLELIEQERVTRNIAFIVIIDSSLSISDLEGFSTHLFQMTPNWLKSFALQKKNDLSSFPNAFVFNLVCLLNRNYQGYDTMLLLLIRPLENNFDEVRSMLNSLNENDFHPFA